VIETAETVLHRMTSPREGTRTQRDELRRLGTADGVWGLERGYCQMIILMFFDGEKEVVLRLDPFFKSLVEVVDEISRTPGPREITERRRRLHALGPSGAGLRENGSQRDRVCMRMPREGLNILKQANAGSANSEVEQRTTPTAQSENYKSDLISRMGRGVETRKSGASWMLD